MHTVVPGRLTARVFTGFEPFVFERDGALVGFDVDILKSFAARAALTLDLLPVAEFEDVWLHPATGQSDLAAAGIARFVERLDPRIAWSEPYFEVLRSILVHRDRAAELGAISDFEGKSIAFVRGSTADLDTRARAPAGARLLPIENQAEGMALLSAGRIDGLAMGAPSNAHNRRMHPAFTLIDVHRFTQPEGLRFPVPSANPLLLAALDEFIGTAVSSGEIDACRERWMPDGVL